MAQQSIKTLKVSKSLYPLDFDRENRMDSYNDWMQYIYEQTRKNERLRLNDVTETKADQQSNITFIDKHLEKNCLS
ncbi:hypothetical protein LZQ00_00650 [Sphingobacterium sp. SRCM116780]|uniref:hypothetical protein n=1 Tax=Sphingobacterium sp. SRCM116780 TaxID=2907623 RepID=UPI001F1B3F8F|nr:hypothetical protein [Sphingobacterium sp. SRCM116780]UIR56351.1 hypothetical protein LZQ00_00650 [Sphingobacterium sp. SRCM116780]